MTCPAPEPFSMITVLPPPAAVSRSVPLDVRSPRLPDTPTSPTASEPPKPLLPTLVMLAPPAFVPATRTAESAGAVERSDAVRRAFLAGRYVFVDQRLE